MTDEPVRAKPRQCPACGHSFIPWMAWTISRFSAIKCPACSTKLTRGFDISFARLLILTLVGVPVLSELGNYFELVEDSRDWWIFYGGTMFIILLIDTFTLRLQPAGEYRRIWGYKI